MNTDEVRQNLAGEQERLQALVTDLRTRSELDSDERTESGGELSTADQNPGDLGTEQMQREIDLSMLEQMEAELSDVERAMNKLQEGTYGTCEACGKEISEERLSAIPIARFCIDDQAKAETEVGLRSTVDSSGINGESTL